MSKSNSKGKNKDINLLDVYNHKEAYTSDKRSKIIIWSIPILLAAVIICTGTVFLTKIISMNFSIEKITTYIENEDTQKKYNESIQRGKELTGIREKQWLIEDHMNMNKPTLGINYNIYDKIKFYTTGSEIRGITYTSGTGEIVVELTVASEIQSSQIARNLDSLDIFQNVEYIGYASGEDSYQSTIVCTLKTQESEAK